MAQNTTIRNKGFADLTKEVVDNGLCVNCGTCKSSCPVKAIRMSDKLSPILEGKCTNCGFCYKTCPGHEVNFPKLQRFFSRNKAHDELLGQYDRLYLCQSNDKAIKSKSTSGGVVSSLLITALSCHIIDAAVVVGVSEQDPLKLEAKVARTKKEVLACAQSKYSPVPVNVILKELENSNERFAFVGLPCHVQGMRKYQELFGLNNLAFCIGLFCGGNLRTGSANYLLKQLGVQASDVVRLEYRAKGWPGGLRVKLKDGTEKFLSKQKYNILFSFSSKRCQLCVDATNELADISVGDAWIPELVACKDCGKWFCEKHGNSNIVEDKYALVIVREARLGSLLKKADLNVEEASREQLLRAQLDNLYRKKKMAFIKMRMLNTLSLKIPNYFIRAPNRNVFLRSYHKTIVFNRTSLRTELLALIDLLLAKAIDNNYKAFGLVSFPLFVLRLYKLIQYALR